MSSAHGSIYSSVGLVASSAVAPHTQPLCPSIWSNAECRSVYPCGLEPLKTQHAVLFLLSEMRFAWENGCNKQPGFVQSWWNRCHCCSSRFIPLDHLILFLNNLHRMVSVWFTIISVPEPPCLLPFPFSIQSWRTCRSLKGQEWQWENVFRLFTLLFITWSKCSYALLEFSL